ncbi:hypothetical protein L1987_53109 [Smallanthus sonchifolius]|uniref:Uncharacterized protein n=1 Tax=Smallanthus sonchifolius TaxID=185202 RepID=A0ACB9EUF9_9ASTR|nr:hypothetical protein L1987_53109 [Smallanthus sonchifolius]
MEIVQNTEVDSQAIEEPQRSLGSGSQESNGKSINVGAHQNSFVSQGDKIKPKKKPVILRPKKNSIQSPLRSPLKDNRLRKRPRAVSEDLFDLNKFLGTGLFGGNVEADDIEDGEIRDECMGVLCSSPINVLDLNCVASPGESVVPGPSSLGDDEVVKDSMADKIVEELNATLKIGDIVGARLGNFNDLVKNTIVGEGNNVVHQ